MAAAALSRAVIIVFGLLYPAYNSYKAIKTRNVTLYVKWMMYWIVFALFYNAETITDLLISWLPMYYELKAIFVLWLLSPVTQGAEVLYGLYIHPRLLQHEQEIEETINKVTTQGYSALLTVGAQGMNMALQGAILGQARLAEQIRKSYSLTDVTDSSEYQPISISELESDTSTEPANISYIDQGLRHRHTVRRSQSEKESTSQLQAASRKSTGQQRPVSDPMTTSLEQRPIIRRERPQPMSADASPKTADSRQIPSRRISAPGRPTTRSPTRPAVESQAKGRATITKPVKRPVKPKTVQPQVVEAAAPESSREGEGRSRRRWSESTLRYRTKKISDIKHQKINSPFISMW